MRTVRRLGQVVAVGCRHGAAELAGRLGVRSGWLRRRLPPVDLDGPQRLRALFEDLGGTFIKLGQMLALQPDILSIAFCNALFDLMDRIPPFEWRDAERIFREEIGRSPDEVFAAIDRRPLATASIGQVYVARLGERPVAVKIQRPDVERDFAGDIRWMRAVVRAIRVCRLRPLYWLLEPLTEFVGWTEEELDYRNEARYMERMRVNAAANAAERVPEVFAAYTTRRTLVVELLDGTTLLEYLRSREAGDEVTMKRIERTGFEPTRFAQNVIDNFLGDAFRFGLFHADLHPANLMILEGNVVGYIDFGITGVLSPFSRRHLVAMTLAYTRGDLEAMTAHFFEVSARAEDADPEAFRRGMLRLADQWYELDGRQRRLRKNFTFVMLDMLTLSRATGILPERDVIKYIRSAIAIDGLITRFAPGFSVGRYLEAVCSRHLRWQALGAAVSYDNLLSWAGAGGRLVGDGPQRSARILERLVGGDLPVAARLAAGDRGDEPRRRAVELAAGILLVALLAVAGESPPSLGWNLFTVEAGLAAAGLALLLPALRRLA